MCVRVRACVRACTHACKYVGVSVWVLFVTVNFPVGKLAHTKLPKSANWPSANWPVALTSSGGRSRKRKRWRKFKEFDRPSEVRAELQGWGWRFVCVGREGWG